MPDTFTQIYIQIVFAVKYRQPLIQEKHREEIQKYITGIVQNKKTKLISIYCMPDHIHILIGLPPSIMLSDLVKHIKVSSTKYINENKLTSTKFNWQEGFGAFSYAHSNLKHVISYIENQELHHQQKTFTEEYILFLQKFDVKYEEKYLFDEASSITCMEPRNS